MASDYVALVVNSEFRDAKGKKRFRFENLWRSTKECENVIKKCWKSNGVNLDLKGIMSRLKHYNHEFINWSRVAFPNNYS